MNPPASAFPLNRPSMQKMLCSFPSATCISILAVQPFAFRLCNLFDPFNRELLVCGWKWEDDITKVDIPLGFSNTAILKKSNYFPEIPARCEVHSSVMCPQARLSLDVHTSEPAWVELNLVAPVCWRLVLAVTMACKTSTACRICVSLERSVNS